MNKRGFLIAFNTIVIKEVARFTRIWLQTIIPPVVSMTLYFLIFGNLIGRRIGTMSGHSYVEYIAPGLIMMSIINNSYANVVSSFFGAKFQRHIEEMLVAPIPPAVWHAVLSWASSLHWWPCFSPRCASIIWPSSSPWSC
jgi:ABC-2 type transport system permease protein